MNGDVILQGDGLRMILRGIDERFLEKVFREWLTERGWMVERPARWEKPVAFCTRLGISIATLGRKLGDQRRPPCRVDRGPGGRLRQLSATPAFEAFCVANKTEPAAAEKPWALPPEAVRAGINEVLSAIPVDDDELQRAKPVRAAEAGR